MGGMIVEIEETIRHEVEIDPAKLIEAFDEEFLDFMAGDNPNDEAIREFVVETVHIMSAEDFRYHGNEWVVNTSRDYDIYVSIRKTQSTPSRPA